MADDDAFGIGGRAGREHDLRNVVAIDGDRRDRPVGRPVEVGQLPDVAGSAIAPASTSSPARIEPRIDDVDGCGRRNPATTVVDRHGDRAGELDAPVACDPFGAVLAPEDDLVAFRYTVRDEPRRKAARRARDIGVRMPPHAIAVVIDEEFTAALFQHPEKSTSVVTREFYS